MFLGALGRLIEIKCPTSLQESRSGGFTFATTLEGNVKAQTLPGGRRVWDVELGSLTTPTDVQTLEQFVDGSWGPGPFAFVPADAPVTNVLTPQVARLDPAGLSASAVSDGPLLTSDGWAARSVRAADQAQPVVLTPEPVPVMVGHPVTASTYVLGAGAYIELVFSNNQGAEVSVVGSPVRATASQVVRSYVTATAPSQAVSCRVRAVNAIQATWPSVTWTNDLMPRSPGHGCAQAVVHGVAKDVVRATERQQFYATGFTVTEVG